MTHLVSHVLIRLAVYPAFYWIGFAVVKSLSVGKAFIMPYSELGAEEGAAWWEFRIRRWGFTEWRPESMIIIGGCFVLLLVSGYYVCRYLF
jgi:hypothetical protein